MARYELDPELRAERNERIVSLRESGNYSNVDIARMVGVNKRTVERVLRSAELTVPSGYHPPHPPELWEEIGAFLNETDASYSEAARTFGVGEKSIARHFPDKGWTIQQGAQFAADISAIKRKADRAGQRVLRDIKIR